MQHLVFLPATEPGDSTYGVAPDRVEAYPSVVVHSVRYPTMVWYNERVRREAIAQIEALRVDSVVLAGFSKSGLGAWNIAREIPRLVSATVIFDAPVARAELPPWGTAPFYRNDEQWREDLPLRTVHAFRTAMPLAHSLVLISGANFHAEMRTLSQALHDSGAEHTFLPRPEMRHHWSAGWIEEGLATLTQRGVLRQSPDSAA